MRILFVSKDTMAGNLAFLLKKEGHSVRLFVEEPDGKRNFNGLVSHTDDWKKDLTWVGKDDGLIIFDDIGFGKIQDKLRKEGYTVFGGSYEGEKLEINRYIGQEIFRHYGIKTTPLLDFHHIDDAVAFLKENRGMWVLKQNGPEREFNYVGQFEDASDTISVLENYKKANGSYSQGTVSLHQRIVGIEMGAARYFNGKNWVGPTEISLEHKRLFPGDVGPTTSEMGTLAWYDDNENNKLFKETLAKIKPFLQKADFRGDFSINCIVNEEGAFPTEATARFGCPIVHLQTELHESPWGEFLYAVAQGKPYNLKWKKGYGLVATVAVPPFPYHFKNHPITSRGMDVFFNDMTEEDFRHIHFEEISKKTDGDEGYYISDDRGYALYVTAVGETVLETQRLLHKRVKKIHIPKMFYRNDIGSSFMKSDAKKLREWGYLNDTSSKPQTQKSQIPMHTKRKQHPSRNAA